MGEPSAEEMAKATKAKELSLSSDPVSREEFTAAVAKANSTIEDMAAKMGMLLARMEMIAPTTLHPLPWLPPWHRK